MTDKNIFAYKLFLSLNVSDFNLFFMWQVTPSFPAPRSKGWGPVKPSLFENLVGGSTAPPPPAERGGGSHYDISN